MQVIITTSIIAGLVSTSKKMRKGGHRKARERVCSQVNADIEFLRKKQGVQQYRKQPKMQ